jgi:cholest-4-en-3-one 26-monooxygenase
MVRMDLADPVTYAPSVPLAWFEQARNAAPLHWHHSAYLERGFWVALTSGLFDRVFSDPKLFSSSEGTVTLDEPTGLELEKRRLFLINMDPPRHTAFRRIVARAFKEDAVEALGAKIDTFTATIFREIPRGEPVDVAKSLANDLPLRVMCELLGADPQHRLLVGADAEVMNFPEDRDLHPAEASVPISVTRLFHYGVELCEAQKRNPSNSIVGMLSTGDVGGDGLTTEEFCFFFLFILVAAFITTKSMLTSTIQLLASHPDQLRQLKRRPELIANAVEEILRMEPPHIYHCRTALRPASIGGVTIEPGQKIALFYHAINRDPALNSNPTEFDVTRPEVRHRSFGRGIHHCLGGLLARREMVSVVRYLVDQDLELVDCGPPVRARSTFLHIFKEYRAVIH